MATTTNNIHELTITRVFVIMVNPLALGSGTLPCKGMKNILDVNLTQTRTFGKGNVLLCYPPVGREPGHV